MKRVRLPLTVGVDTLWRMAGASALLVPSVVVVGSGVVLILQDYGGVARVLLGLVGMLLSLALLGLAWYARASDVALDEAGLSIEGGWHGGVKLGWDQIGKVILQNADKPDSDLVLEIRSKAGKKYVLAEAANDTEKASVMALHETLSAKMGERRAEPARAADVATCSSCGAPLTPSEQERVRCGSCGADNPVRPALRERVAAHRAVEHGARATSAAVAKLLDQPGARWASAILFVAGMASALGWLPVIVSYILVGVRSLGWFEVGIGLFNGWAFTFAFFAFARVALAKRRALHVLSTTFGARPPDRPGEGPGCRSCGAPLPASGVVVVRCAYCDTESVLGMNVRPLMREVQAHRGSIDELLSEQRAERFRWAGLAVGGLAATVIGGFWLLVQVVVAYEVAQERSACEKGSAQGCFDLGLSYAAGSTVDQDDEAAFKYFSKACSGGHAEACNDVAKHLEEGWGTAQDPVQAGAKRKRSCQFGFKPACEAMQKEGSAQ